jgi:D-hexose-6-phosphate mutarotase
MYTTALEPTETLKAIYDKPWRFGAQLLIMLRPRLTLFASLVYVVTLAGHQISTDLHVTNTGSEAFEFQALFHNYIAAPADHVLVTPLRDLQYHDKTANETKKETRDGVDVRKFTDSVYSDASGDYKVVWATGGIEIKTKNLKDVVVWNPRETGASMGDMEPDGWCVFAVIIDKSNVVLTFETGSSMFVLSRVMSAGLRRWRQDRGGLGNRSFL